MSFFQNFPRLLLLTIFSILISLVIFFPNENNVKRNLLVLPEFSKITIKPQNKNILTPPAVSAEAVLVTDYKTGEILFEKNKNLKLTPASLTKLATAQLVLEKCSKDQIVTVPQISTPSGTKMGLLAGEKITVENLLYGLLLPSGNDAANVLMLVCFGNLGEFLSSINKFTQKLNMINTQLVNPSGLPAKNHFSTAEDLLKLTKAALANKTISEIVLAKEKTVTDSTGEISHKLVNLNKLLKDPKVLGVKTGRTNFGENLIVLKEIHGNKVISIVLQSDDRFADSEKILDWIEKNFSWEENLLKDLTTF